MVNSVLQYPQNNTMFYLHLSHFGYTNIYRSSNTKHVDDKVVLSCTFTVINYHYLELVVLYCPIEHPSVFGFKLNYQFCCILTGHPPYAVASVMLSLISLTVVLWLW